ncbi:hypothetical protein [Vulgatibacter sp.]|uniref:hypothetical protein n=1 Tax=Vulgatibacter sp. TaxID=1971226 RepID=UPI00356864F5
MIVRNHHLLAVIAALGVLLHAGMAAAQVFCAMTGTLTTSCCCPGDEGTDGPVLKSADGCCRDALPAPAFDLHQQQASLPGPALAAAWQQVIFAEPAALPARPEPVPAGTSPPLLGLQTIVLIR